MSVGTIIIGLQKLYHVVATVFALIPMLVTMGMNDKPGTEVIINENATNPYIVEYGNPDISAHRSGAGVAPQNTLMAFETMLKQTDEYGVDTFEFDVQLTADGELIVMHDLTYDSTTNAVEFYGRSDVKATDLTLAEAKANLNMGENFELNGEYPYRGLRGEDIPDNLRVPTAQEVIDLIEANKNGTKYNYIIEIKNSGKEGYKAADKLYEIVTERDLWDRVIWASSKPMVSYYMRTEYTEVPRSAGIDEVLQFYIYARMGWDLDVADVSYVALQIPYGDSAANGLINLGTREVINYAHKYNIAAQYWTINGEEAVEYLTANGADCIMTDYPDMAYEVVTKMNK